MAYCSVFCFRLWNVSFIYSKCNLPLASSCPKICKMATNDGSRHDTCTHCFNLYSCMSYSFTRSLGLEFIRDDLEFGHLWHSAQDLLEKSTGLVLSNILYFYGLVVSSRYLAHDPNPPNRCVGLDFYRRIFLYFWGDHPQPKKTKSNTERCWRTRNIPFVCIAWQRGTLLGHVQLHHEIFLILIRG